MSSLRADFLSSGIFRLIKFSSYKPKDTTIAIIITITNAIIIVTNIKDTDLPFPVAIWSW